MRKQEFLDALASRLTGLPREDAKERLAFYGEMIDDRMEEGFSEEEAVAAIGSVDEVAAQIIADTPFLKIAKERIKPKRRPETWEIVLLAVGAPLWLALAVVAFAVVLSVYVVLWAVDVSLWAVFAAVVSCASGCTAAGTAIVVGEGGPSGIALIGAGIFCAGLAVFLFFGCKAATKGIVWLTKRIALGIKKGFARKENAA